MPEAVAERISVCSECSIWVLDQDDQYCPWCGSKLIDLDVQPTALVLQQDEADASREIRLRNRGQVVLKGISLECAAPWVRLSQQSVPRLEAGAELPVSIRLVKDRMPAEYESTVLEVRTSGLERDVLIELFPALRLEAKIEGGPVVLKEGTQVLRVLLEATSGLLKVLDVPASAEEWFDVAAVDQLPYTLNSAKKNRLKLEITVDRGALDRSVEAGAVRLDADATGKRSVGVGFRLATERPPEVRIGAVRVEVRRPQTLGLVGAHRTADCCVYEIDVDDIYCGERRIQPASIVNEGDEPLRVEAVEVALGAGGEWLKVTSDFSGRGVTIRPPTEAGDGPASLDLDVTIDACEATPGVPLADAIRISSNSYPQGEFLINVSALPREMPEFDGVVAVDYGTTSSCCAAYQLGQKAPLIVQLEGRRGRLSDSMPSVVMYERLLDDGRRDYEVGSYALQALSTVEAAASVVQASKRYLGSDKRFTVYCFTDRTKLPLKPSEVSADIIRELLRSTETQLRRRISRCAATYPVKFTYQQVNELRTAFESCGVTVDLMIPEPVAAGIDYIRTDAFPEKYSMLVCDFGGGTTDLCLFSVVTETNAAGDRMVKPRLLGADTKNWFGGENVTKVIIDRFQQQLEKSTERRIPLTAPHDRVGDAVEVQRGVENWGRLWWVAERWKLQLSAADDSDTAPEKVYGLNLDDGTVGGGPVSMTLSDVQDAVLVSMRGISDMGRRMVDAAISRGDIADVDFLVLTGNASQLPMVRQTIREEFPRSRFADELEVTEDADDDGEVETILGLGLKTCVARGACWAQLLRSAGSFTIDYDGLNVATNTVGILDFDNRGATVRPVASVGAALGVWHAGGTVRADRTVQIVEETAERPIKIREFVPREMLLLEERERVLEAQLTDLELQRKALENRLTELDEDRARWEGQLDQPEGQEKQNAEAELADLEADKNTLNGRLSKLEEQRKALENQLNELKAPRVFLMLTEQHEVRVKLEAKGCNPAEF